MIKCLLSYTIKNYLIAMAILVGLLNFLEVNKMNITNKGKIGEIYIEPEEWGNLFNKESDFCLAELYSSYHSNDSCDFIFWLGSEILWSESTGFSEKFCNIFKEAKQQGYEYLLIYS